MSSDTSSSALLTNSIDSNASSDKLSNQSASSQSSSNTLGPAPTSPAPIPPSNDVSNVQLIDESGSTASLNTGSLQQQDALLKEKLSMLRAATIAALGMLYSLVGLHLFRM